MPFKPGQIVYVKTTREPAFVLAVANGDSSFSAVVSVRLPIATRDGIVHKVVEFYSEELESGDESSQRELDEMNRKRQLWESQLKASQANGGQMELFPIEAPAENIQ